MKRSFFERVRGKLFREWHNFAFPFWRLTQRGPVTTPGPIQLIGCDRSGTTITSLLFCRHPDVFDFRDTLRIWSPRDWRNPQADHYRTAADLTPRDADRLRSRFEFERRMARAKRVFNQVPNNSVRIGYVRAIFPDAYFIHTIRDGRAVVESIVRLIRQERFRQQDPMGWFTKPPNWRELLRDDLVEQTALQWRAVVEHILEQAPGLGDHYTECRYEDVCADPRGEIGRLWRFCGLRCDEQTLSLLPERLRSENVKWKTRLTPEQIRIVNGIQGPLLRKLGYQVEEEATARQPSTGTAATASGGSSPRPGRQT